MRRESRSWRVAGIALAGGMMMLGRAVAVSAEGAQAGAQGMQRPVPAIGAPESSDPMPGKLQEQQARAAVDDRHKRLVSDADRLLVLATELKQEVDKSTKDELSVTAIKRAGEIEKLARDVKDRMKGN
jgi:hypothetical protein